MTTKTHLATLAHYPSLLVSSTAKTALMEIERLETALAIAVGALERIGNDKTFLRADLYLHVPSVAHNALTKIREMK